MHQAQNDIPPAPLRTGGSSRLLGSPSPSLSPLSTRFPARGRRVARSITFRNLLSPHPSASSASLVRCDAHQRVARVTSAAPFQPSVSTRFVHLFSHPLLPPRTHPLSLNDRPSTTPPCLPNQASPGWMPAPHHPTTLRRISSHSPLTLPRPPSSPPAASTSPRPRHPGYLRAHSVSGVIGAVPLEHHSYWTSPSPRGRRDPHQNSTRDGNDADDSDFEDEFLRVGAGRGRARPRTMMVGVAAAREREEDSELLLEQEEGRVGLGLVGIEFPLSPPPEKRERMLRRDSTGTIETLGSRRSRSPSSVRNSGGSEGMTMRMLGHAKADAS